jgi:hypothetical protein
LQNSARVWGRGPRPCSSPPHPRRYRAASSAGRVQCESPALSQTHSTGGKIPRSLSSWISFWLFLRCSQPAEGGFRSRPVQNRSVSDSHGHIVCIPIQLEPPLRFNKTRVAAPTPRVSPTRRPSKQGLGLQSLSARPTRRQRTFSSKVARSPLHRATSFMRMWTARRHVRPIYPCLLSTAGAFTVATRLRHAGVRHAGVTPVIAALSAAVGSKPSGCDVSC